MIIVKIWTVIGNHSLPFLSSGVPWTSFARETSSISTECLCWDTSWSYIYHWMENTMLKNVRRWHRLQFGRLQSTENLQHNNLWCMQNNVTAMNTAEVGHDHSLKASKLNQLKMWQTRDDVVEDFHSSARDQRRAFMEIYTLESPFEN